MAGRPRKSGMSVTTEMVLGAAAQNLKKAVAELNIAVEGANVLSTKAEELSLLVSNKEDEINALTTQFAERERQMTLDLDLKMKANAEQVVASHLSSNGRTAIATAELNALRKELETIKADYTKNVAAEVGRAEGIAKSRYEQERRLLEAEHKGNQAESTATITQLNEKVKFLESQATQWKQQLDSERQASIERAKAGAIGTIQVGDQGYRK